jgi:hypothetical protein
LFEGSDHFSECSHHGCICARGHGANYDCIEIIDICNKNILHTFELANRECTGDVGVLCASDGVGQCGKAKYILHGAHFVLGEYVIDFSTCSYNDVVIVSCGGSV